MAFGNLEHGKNSQPMSDINVTPLVDVMLVLLVIFILSAPMLSNAVKLELPSADAGASSQQAATVLLAIDGAGQIFWNNDPVDSAALEARLEQAAQRGAAPSA